MKIFGKILTGIFFASASVVGVAAFFDARDNHFAYDLSAKTQNSYLAAQKAEYGDVSGRQSKLFEAIQNEGKISSMKDARKIYGNDVKLYDIASANFNKNTRPLFSMENQMGEDKYYQLNDEYSPAQLRKMKYEQEQLLRDKVRRLSELSNTDKMRDFDRYNLAFAHELRKFVEKHPKRFYEGQSLFEVADKIVYVDYLQVLEKVIFNKVREKTKAKENTREFAVAYAEVAERYFLPAIWTANQISLVNKNFVLE